MTSTFERAFADLVPDRATAAALAARLRERMAGLNDSGAPRIYHVEPHIVAVLDLLYEWTGGAPSPALLAAALYHDADYDATRGDNELRSAAFCHDELLAAGIATIDLVPATHFILLTAHHQPNRRSVDEVRLVDADLYILGAPPAEYDAYVAAVREEYRHVSADAWRVGRRAVLESFAARDRIYLGDWPGHEDHEDQARANLRREIADL